MSKSIACHVRVRPGKEADGKMNEEGIVIEGNKISAMNGQGDKRYHFEFEKCHAADSTQDDVFDHVKPLLDRAWKGVNTTIFAYGVTGAGKTHTMQGTRQDPGLIPRAVNAILNRQAELSTSTVQVSMSYVEILKDEVYDLLGSANEPRKRDIRTSTGGQNVVADLIYQPITSWEQFEVDYDVASKSRKTASTKLNSSSSRSHAILTIYLHVIDEAGKVTDGKICLTDLAGSENNNLTGNDKERMRESSAINTSLTTLGKVVDALNVVQQKGGDASGVFIPYRESKLTRLLQVDALGGTSQGLLICCLAPGEKFARDTINTLQFGKKSKAVENRLNDNRRDSRRLSALPTKPRASLRVHTDASTAPTTGRPSLGRPALAPIAANTRQVKVQPRASMAKSVGKKVTLDLKENVGLGLTEEQLEKRIQKIVTQEMANAREKERPVEAPLKPVVEHPFGEAVGMSDEEKDTRAKVIVKHARSLQQSGNLEGALDLYKKAYDYVPGNQKLATRIAEIQLSLEGILPPPELSGRSRHHDKSTTSSKAPLKRSRAPAGSTSLAELSYEAEDESDVVASVKKMKNNDSTAISMTSPPF
ncbi:microtubule motor protein [Cryptococcus wingfieldii CBS 7118]|uniref:Microtubule motor protein n=1 Tax=Cryptococcus wingfieldii CBS 7118 TaxID=1295528 RepID=A0A1E3JRV8_9TREE|nr:microtubule motor protein [Cryptococcus wingfieldii CBS 7118]ODO03406.1 microtubule motor protein [Cryptococcus wingfieldii CBS 7118]